MKHYEVSGAGLGPWLPRAAPSSSRVSGPSNGPAPRRWRRRSVSGAYW